MWNLVRSHRIADEEKKRREYEHTRAIVLEELVRKSRYRRAGCAEDKEKKRRLDEIAEWKTLEILLRALSRSKAKRMEVAELKRRIYEDVYRKVQEECVRVVNHRLSIKIEEDERSRRINEIGRDEANERLLNQRIAQKLEEEERQRRIADFINGNDCEAFEIAFYVSAAVRIEGSYDEAFQHRLSCLELNASIYRAERGKQARIVLDIERTRLKMAQERRDAIEFVKAQYEEERFRRIEQHESGSDISQIVLARIISVAFVIESGAIPWTSKSIRAISEDLLKDERERSVEMAIELQDAEQKRRMLEMVEAQELSRMCRRKSIEVATIGAEMERFRRIFEIEEEKMKYAAERKRIQVIVKRVVDREQRARIYEYAAGEDDAKIDCWRFVLMQCVVEAQTRQFQHNWVRRNVLHLRLSRDQVEQISEESRRTIVIQAKRILRINGRRRSLEHMVFVTEEERKRRIKEEKANEELEQNHKLQNWTSVHSDIANEGIIDLIPTEGSSTKSRARRLSLILRTSNPGMFVQ